SGGTLLLDEVSEMPFHLQAKLLRALQEGEIDRLGGGQPVPVQTRVVATTNVDPAMLIQKGTFRADLYYRLNVIRIDCPALGGRSGAIEALAGEMLKRACFQNGAGPKVFSPSALERLTSYGWPGNIRELQNAIERGVLVCDGDQIEEAHLDLRPIAGVVSAAPDLASVEEHHILKTLDQSQGNRSEAARRLGISVRTLRNKLKEFGT
ncbi:sigma 54-interacting transcriptional regulator, partial [bacterium]|nr:sigma 54-interacting transcriptional regulator [bacterium]